MSTYIKQAKYKSLKEAIEEHKQSKKKNQSFNQIKKSISCKY